MEFTKDLDKDIIVHKMGLFSVKRYSYTPFDGWIEHDGTPIKERVFSFILMRGPKWFNSTHLNFRESRLDEVLPSYEKIFAEMQKKRRNDLTVERAARKQFPRKHEFIFDNATIVAIEKPCYYHEGTPRTYGGYFEPKEKIVELYVNGMSYRRNVHTDVDTKIDLEFIIDRTIENDINKFYSVKEFKEPFVSNEVHKFNFSYIPAFCMIGYVFEFNGVEIGIKNFRGSTSYRGAELETTDGKITVSLPEFMEKAKHIGELTGINAWVSLLNKVRYA